MSLDPIDLIYEAAFAPELWAGALSRTGREIGAAGGALVTGELAPDRWIETENVDSMARIVAQGSLLGSEYGRRVLGKHRDARFYADQEDYSEEALAATPLLRDHFVPKGMLFGLSTSFALPTGDNVLIGWRRTIAAGPFPPEAIALADSWRPHLGRATLISARLQLRAAQAAAATLQAIGVPAVVVNGRGVALAANTLFEALKERVSVGAWDRVAIADPVADRQFREALTTHGEDLRPATRSFPVRDGEGAPCRVAHVIPLRRGAKDIFAGGVVALVLTAMGPRDAPPVELLQALFDLTSTEAALARALAAGDSLDAFARARNVSRNTARTHLRMLMQKAGCNRQSEIVALLSGLTI